MRPANARTPSDCSFGRIRQGRISIPAVAATVHTLIIVLRGGVRTKDNIAMIAAPDNHTTFATPAMLQLSARAAGIIAMKKEQASRQFPAATLSPATVTKGWLTRTGRST